MNTAIENFIQDPQNLQFVQTHIDLPCISSRCACAIPTADNKIECTNISCPYGLWDAADLD